MILRRDVGVIFDMDGVLVDSAAAHLRSWEVLAESCGTSVTEERCAALFGRHNNDIIPELFGDVSPERLDELADQKESIYRDLVRSAPPLVDGAASLIDDLHRAGVRLGVGSSGPPLNIELILDALDARHKFEVIVSGADVTRGKPDPQVFELACDRLGLAASRCVVIEDAPVGVRAAKGAGAKTVAVLIYQDGGAFDAPDVTVETLAQLSADMVMSLASG